MNLYAIKIYENIYRLKMILLKSNLAFKFLFYNSFVLSIFSTEIRRYDI